MAETLAVRSSLLAPCCCNRFRHSTSTTVRVSCTRIPQEQASAALNSWVGGLRANDTASLVIKHRDESSNRWVWRQPKSLRVLCTQIADSSTTLNADTKPVSSKVILVLGATGGVGQLVVASLLEKGVKVRCFIRNEEKARSLFGDQLGDQFEFLIGDTRRRDALNESIFEGVTHVISVVGTTAFPSKRWKGDNGPEQTNWIGVRNLVDSLPKTLKRIVLVSAVGVTKYDALPWSILNLFGVLKYMKMGEDYLRKSGIPFTIIRAGRYTDGPYTSYDLNTLLKATAGTRRNVTLGQGDKLVGEASRIAVAEACVNALDLDCTKDQTYEIMSVEGDGPGKDPEKWAALFQAVHST